MDTPQQQTSPQMRMSKAIEPVMSVVDTVVGFMASTAGIFESRGLAVVNVGTEVSYYGTPQEFRSQVSAITFECVETSAESKAHTLRARVPLVGITSLTQKAAERMLDVAIDGAVRVPFVPAVEVTHHA